MNIFTSVKSLLPCKILALTTLTFLSLSCGIKKEGVLDVVMRSGEMGSDASNALSQPPLFAAIGLSFEDKAVRGGFLEGMVTISRASDESSISHYVLYWGSDSETKLADLPSIAKLDKRNANLTFNIPAGTFKPAQATHLIVFTQNASGEMRKGTNLLIIDKGVPMNAAVSVAFTDSNGQGKFLSGDIQITKATDESDVTDYVVYWGKNSIEKLNPTPLTTLPKSRSPLASTLTNEAIPKGASHLLVFSKNKDGEMAIGFPCLIIDKGVPVNAAGSVAFTDTDVIGGKIAGEIQISKAADEIDITEYVIYFGSNATTKQSPTPIATLPKTSQNLSFTLSKGTIRPTNATHLLVFTRNKDGEMASGVSSQIIDTGVPVYPASSIEFRDINEAGGLLGGDIVISKAADETKMTDYVIYFGSDPTTKQSATPIATLVKTGQNLKRSIYSVIKPANATHLLVFTKNADSEMTIGVATPIVDKGVPINKAGSVAFTDTDVIGGKIAGEIQISKAADEIDITEYVIYFGSNATTKQSPTPIATLPKTSQNLRLILSEGTIRPTDANYLLVFTRNKDGEMASGVSSPIIDKGIVTQIATGHDNTCALLSDQSVKCWGLLIQYERNERGSSWSSTSSPTPIPSLSGVSSISNGGWHICALIGQIAKCWGRNEYGQIGSNNRTDTVSPQTVVQNNRPFSQVKAISAGGFNTCALSVYGLGYCWGSNSHGQLGRSDTGLYSPETMLVDPPYGLRVSSISSGGGLNCAIMEDKTVKCWGFNANGELGDGTTTDRSTPTTVLNLSNVRSISLGTRDSCALMEDKTVKCWGRRLRTPTSLPNLSNVKSIALGDDAGCAVMEDKTVKCWGDNYLGRLGFDHRNKDAAPSCSGWWSCGYIDSPTTVPNLSNVESVSIGYRHTCALMEDKTLKCWGFDLARIPILNRGYSVEELSSHIPKEVIGL